MRSSSKSKSVCHKHSKKKPKLINKLKNIKKPKPKKLKKSIQDNLSFAITYKSLFKFTFPTILSSIFMAFYSMVDGFFVSNFINTDALASVNIVFPAFSIVIGIGIMFSVGTSALIGTLLGRNKLNSAREALSSIVVILTLFGIGVGIFGFSLNHVILKILGASELTYDFARYYLNVFCLFVPFIMMQILFQNIFITVGKPQIGLILAVIGGGINVVLDYVFIVVLKLGTGGAALATGIGTLIPSIYSLYYFRPLSHKERNIITYLRRQKSQEYFSNLAPETNIATKNNANTITDPISDINPSNTNTDITNSTHNYDINNCDNDSNNNISSNNNNGYGNESSKNISKSSSNHLNLDSELAPQTLASDKNSQDSLSTKNSQASASSSTISSDLLNLDVLPTRKFTFADVSTEPEQEDNLNASNVVNTLENIPQTAFQENTIAKAGLASLDQKLLEELTHLQLYLVKPRFNFKFISQTISNGSSEMVTNLSVSLTTLVFNILAKHYAGANGIAAITIILYSEYILNAILMGYCVGLTPLIAYNAGQGNTAKLRKIVTYSFFSLLTVAVIVFIYAQFFGNSLINVFAHHTQAVQALAQHGLTIFSFSFLFIFINIMTINMFTGISNGKISAYISLARSLVFLLGMLGLLPLFFGINGIWLAVPIAELLSNLVSLYYFKHFSKKFGFS